MDDGLLLQLSQLKQLTLLDYYGPMEGAMEGARFMSTVSLNQDVASCSSNDGVLLF
jgi:hypothetical protein